ncbi:MAG: 16S rRNA (uracil(1498)-N(3))-methyltransferase [Actinobacteria bacterium]|nr:16S rRNA (uracil(1498)-N(3))-methyltransferase [Actinomycetota bacterium]
MTYPVFISSANLQPAQTVVLDRAICEVVAVGKKSLDAKTESVHTEAKPNVTFTVVQALAKGDRSDLALEILTEVGVDEIVPWAAAHSIAKWDATDKGLLKWQRIVREASKQARRAWLPRISALHATGEVAQLLAEADLALVLHESATDSISALKVPVSGSVAVVVGPEGGISPEELTTFAAAGAQIVRMGAPVMRTSTAGGVALGVLMSATKRWEIPTSQ